MHSSYLIFKNLTNEIACVKVKRRAQQTEGAMAERKEEQGAPDRRPAPIFDEEFRRARRDFFSRGNQANMKAIYSIRLLVSSMGEALQAIISCRRPLRIQWLQELMIKVIPEDREETKGVFFDVAAIEDLPIDGSFPCKLFLAPSKFDGDPGLRLPLKGEGARIRLIPPGRIGLVKDMGMVTPQVIHEELGRSEK